MYFVRCLIPLLGAISLALIARGRCLGKEPARLSLVEEPAQLVIRHGERPVATYVFRHERVTRPFFYDLFASTGERVSRSFPPTGDEATDHDTLHPGLWLSFGDISGVDFWRNKATVQHREFVVAPKIDGEQLSFVVRNAYRDGEMTVCQELCRHTIAIRPSGYLITYDSEFSGEQPFTFGDQEEMGLGVRMTAGLRVTGGKGRIVNSDGLENESQARGKQANWCDLSGPAGDHYVGILLMAHPENFRRSWFHLRDYGLAVANPFGRNALSGAEPSQVTVKPGEKLRLRFAVFIHSTNDRPACDPELTFRDYIDFSRTLPSPSRQ